jgi:YaaC-like Protein
MYEPLSSDNNIEHNVAEITLLSRQAIELYKASQVVNIYAKPFLLYYSYLKLARVLFLSTFESEEAKRGHGLKLEDDECLIVLTNGSFQRFHDSYSRDPSIYLNSCKFSWRDLINEKTGRYALVLNMSDCNAVPLYERNSENDQYLEHELTREIMFTYAMSMLARYKVQNWNRLVEGRKEDVIWKISEYLTSTQTLFPNLIYNQLQGGLMQLPHLPRQLM